MVPALDSEAARTVPGPWDTSGRVLARNSVGSGKLCENEGSLAPPLFVRPEPPPARSLVRPVGIGTVFGGDLEWGSVAALSI